MENKDQYVLCTDLDRTLIPNGPQPESSGAKSCFKRLVAHDHLRLAYVSGRDLQRILNAISEYDLPEPDFIVADVGSSIYEKRGGEWALLTHWVQSMECQWPMKKASELARGLPQFEDMQLQQEDQQGTFKLSFEVQPSARVHKDLDRLQTYLSELRKTYSEHGEDFRYRCILSIDETKDEALVDLLPEAAGKLSAVRFIIEHLGLPSSAAFFSGDSGNDEDVLLSELPACVVANATAEFKQSLREKLSQPAQLYFANGSLNDELNGNYSAGIVEGFIHFFPHLKTWIDQE